MGLFDYPDETASPAGVPGITRDHDFIFLNKLSKEDWNKILTIVEKFQFRGGDTIFNAGDHDDSFYILSAGSVSVLTPDRRGRLTTIAEIPTGSVFGESAFFTGEPRNATIRAREDGSAIRITRENFEHLAAWHPQIARQMLLDLGCILSLRLRWTTALVHK
jgi:CRP/FNR family transcriptional regulator, cyclic AMP receptor protein